MKYLAVIIIVSVSFIASADKKHGSNNGHHNLHPKNKAYHSYHLGHRKAGLKYRDNSPDVNHQQHCDCQPGDGPPKLTIIYNEDSGLIAAINASSNMALILDYTDSVIILAQPKLSIITNYSSNTIYQLNETLIPSKEALENSTFLKPLLEKAQQPGAAANLSDPGGDVAIEINRILTNLGWSSSSNPTEDIKRLIQQLNGPLKVLYKGAGAFEIHLDLGTFIKVNLALADLLANARDTQSIGPLNLNYIFSAQSGFGIYLNVLGQIGEHADLAKVFGNLLTGSTKLLHLIQGIDNAVSHAGIDGHTSANIEIMLCLYGPCYVDEIIGYLAKYTPDGVQPSEVEEKLRQFLDILDNQIKTYNNHDGIAGYYDFTEELINGTLVIRNVNITDVADFLYFRSPREVLHSLISIAIQLFTLQNIPFLVQTAFNSKIFQQLIAAFVPNISLSDIGQAFSNPSAIWSLASHLPVIGPVLPQIFETLRYFIGNLGETASRDLQIVLNDVSDGSLSDASINILRNFLGNLSNFIEHIASLVGMNISNPLSAIFNFIGSLSSGADIGGSGSFLWRLGFNEGTTGSASGNTSVSLPIGNRKASSNHKHDAHKIEGKKKQTVHTSNSLENTAW